MMTMSDLQAAKRFLEQMSGDAPRPVSVLAAVSGGIDSMCLLHLLATWGRKHHFRVTAAHFNHRLRGEAADRDEAFVREICAQWEVPCVCGSGDTRALAAQEGLSLEEAGRKLRYAFLEQARCDGQHVWILTAHHADDHAETMLLNLLRGTGAKGLTGIPDYRDRIARPFLKSLREELEAYAKKHHVPHIEDETNRELDATRNVLRHRVLPVLRELNPRVVENMTRTAELLSQDEDALQRQAETLLRDVRWDEAGNRVLPESICREQPKAVVSRALLQLLADVGGGRKDLSYVHVEAVLELLYTGRAGQSCSLPYGMTALRQNDGISIRRSGQKSPEAQSVTLGQSVFFGDWQISLTERGLHTGEDAYSISLPEDAAVQVTCWQSGDRMTLSGSRGSRTVKRLAAERGISPAERDVLPVLRVNGCPAVIPGIGIDEEFTPDPQKSVVMVIFLKQMIIEENSHDEK